MSNLRTVIVKGSPIQKEGTAGGTIKPGHLIKLGATLVVHDSAGGDTQPRFAIENADIGKGVDDSYSSGDNVKYIVGRPGDEVQAILKNGQTVSIGTALVSYGDGTLKPYTGQVIKVDLTKTSTTVTAATVHPDCVVGYSLEGMTASGDSKLLIEVA